MLVEIFDALGDDGGADPINIDFLLRPAGRKPLAGAKKPALRLKIDFGPKIGVKTSSAQLTGNYAAAALIGRQVAAVVNFPPRQIGKFMSQVLTLGFPDGDGSVVLVVPDKPIPNGGKLF